MDEPTYDLILRDPEGGILQRWLLDEFGLPRVGTGVRVSLGNVWDDIVETVENDVAARKERA